MHISSPVLGICPHCNGKFPAEPIADAEEILSSLDEKAYGADGNEMYNMAVHPIVSNPCQGVGQTPIEIILA